ncbi:MAG: DNA repair protein RadC [Candidatus Aminicenantes bacterium]|nr:MAG: DNA repair protein RadC [Candidatus Aminicenantes bacterium]
MARYKKAQYKRKKMKDYPDVDRPREKMIRRGAKSLSILELMAVMVGSGNVAVEVYDIAKDLARLVEDEFHQLTVDKLQSVNGIGKAKACQIMAAIEFSRRFLVKKIIKINDYHDVLPLVEDLRDKKQEYFLTLTLDGAHNLIEKRTIFIGTLNESLVHPREIFADAITDRAAAIIFVHNHTSTDVTPSEADIQVTQRLKEVAETMGIEVLDHIIVTHTKNFSFKNNGLLHNR